MKISVTTLLIFSLVATEASAFVASPQNSFCPAPLPLTQNRRLFQPLQMVTAGPRSDEFPFTMPFADHFSKRQEEMERVQARKRRRMVQLEKEVRASTQAKLDLNRVKDAFTTDGDVYETHAEADVEFVNMSFDDVSDSKTTVAPTQFSVALASGSAFGLLSFIALHMPMLSFIIFGLTTYVASRDPIRDEEFAMGDITGPVSRIVGRKALDYIEEAKPKVRAVVRAVVASGSYDVLNARNQKLEEENEEMKLWMERRKAIDGQAKYYTLDALKDIARESDLKVSGTKIELMMRLIDAGCLKDDQEQFYTLAKLKKIAKRDKLKVSGTKAQLMERLIEAGSLKVLV